MPCFVENKGAWRTRQEAIPAIENNLGEVIVDIDKKILVKLLHDEPILIQEVLAENQADYIGPLILGCSMVDSTALVSVYCGNWVSLMINDLEQDILRAKLSIPFKKTSGV